MPKAALPLRNRLVTNAHRWPLLLGAMWAMMFERAERDDALVIQEALVNHRNVAQAMANHTEQMLDRLRFYGQTLTRDEPDDFPAGWCVPPCGR